jgi:Copper amine oxidase N-terminal domain
MLNVSKKIIIGSIAGALLFTGGMMVGSNSALAKKATEAIRANFANIKIFVNGQEIKTKAEPFTYNGNVYVPAATIANMLGIGQTWDNDTPAVRFESTDRAQNSPLYAGMQGRQSYPHPLDYVYALRPYFEPSRTSFEKVVNSVNNQELALPKMESGGTLTPISRMVHANMFYMLEQNSQGSFINGYQIDKVKITVSKVFSRQIEPVQGSLSFNEATREFTEKIYTRTGDTTTVLTGIKFYGIDWENGIRKTGELLTQ